MLQVVYCNFLQIEMNQGEAESITTPLGNHLEFRYGRALRIFDIEF